MLFNLGMLAMAINGRNDPTLVQIQTNPIPGKEYIGKVKMDGVSIRLLVLKHTFEQMANDDARLAIDAANLARTNGLTIKDIGEHNIGPNGQVNRLVFDRRFYGLFDVRFSYTGKIIRRILVSLIKPVLTV